MHSPQLGNAVFCEQAKATHGAYNTTGRHPVGCAWATNHGRAFTTMANAACVDNSDQASTGFPLLTQRVKDASKGRLRISVDAHGQRGLVATTKLARGTVVLQERSLWVGATLADFMAFKVRPPAAAGPMWAELCTPSVRKQAQFFLASRVFAPEVQFFAFGFDVTHWAPTGRRLRTESVSILFGAASLFNHECVALDETAPQDELGRRLVGPAAVREIAIHKSGRRASIAVVLTRDVDAGEEVRIHYCSTWFADHGVVCTCRQCRAHKAPLSGPEWQARFPSTPSPFKIHEALHRASGLAAWVEAALPRLPPPVMVAVLARNSMELLYGSVVDEDPNT